MIKKIIKSIFFAGAIISNPVFSATYEIRQAVPGIQNHKEKTEDPEFWMLENQNLKGKFPAFINGSSVGRSVAKFNFGQRPFIGDSLGFLAYDKRYSDITWSGIHSFDGEGILGVNLIFSKYLKTYNSGKYYFEADIVQTYIHDAIGFVSINAEGSNGFYSDGFMGTSYQQNKEGTQIISNGVHSNWAKNYSLKAGDSIQVWVDFDKGNLLIKKLGTTKEDHFYKK